LLADQMDRVQHIQESYDQIGEMIGIPSRPLDEVYAPSQRACRDYYDRQLIDGVARIYARDLELFVYQF
jgi:hypothetical protein